MYIAGNLNSKCKDFLVYIPFDDLFYIFGNIDYDGSTFDIPRNNKDNIRGNNYGKSLVNLCYIFDIHILNGHFPGDRCGEFTCFSNDGASVVDYMTASSLLFQYIKDFKDLDRDDSDHFPVSCVFEFSYRSNNIVNNINDYPLNTWKKFRWRNSLCDEFVLTLRGLLHSRYNTLLDTIDSNVNSAVDLITAIYQDAGKCMLVNFRYFSSQPHWWDDECDYLKSVKYIALRKFRSSNLESDLRLFKDKRNFLRITVGQKYTNIKGQTAKN